MSQSTKFRGVATTIERDGDEDRYIYHHTAVVVHDRLRHIITLDSGGWRTATTKTRMNQASFEFDLGFTVHQKAYEWYVVTKAGKLVFERGMRIDMATGKRIWAKS